MKAIYYLPYYLVFNQLDFNELRVVIDDEIKKAFKKGSDNEDKQYFFPVPLGLILIWKEKLISFDELLAYLFVCSDAQGESIGQIDYKFASKRLGLKKSLIRKALQSLSRHPSGLIAIERIDDNNDAYYLYGFSQTEREELERGLNLLKKKN